MHAPVATARSPAIFPSLDPSGSTFLKKKCTCTDTRPFAPYKTNSKQRDWLPSIQCQHPMSASYDKWARLGLNQRDFPSFNGMESLDERCTPLKAKYDECFNSWFRGSFLKGRDNHKETCGRLFTDYQACLKVPACHASWCGVKGQSFPNYNIARVLSIGA